MTQIKKIGFQLIHDGLDQRGLRKLKDILKNSITREEMITKSKKDSVKAISESEEPIKLINRAIKNLEIIDPKHSSLKNSESIQRLDILSSILEKILRNSK